MKHILIPAIMTVMAAPAFADAEAFGEEMLEQHGGSSSSAATFETAADVLEGDNVDEKLPYNDGEIVTRADTGMTIGREQMAASLGVDPNDYTLSELADMFISAHN